MSKPDGGAAFSRPYSKSGNYTDSESNFAQKGMSLRDYFAAKAMGAMIANGKWVERMATSTGQDSDVCISKAAFEIADAMLKQREQP